MKNIGLLNKIADAEVIINDMIFKAEDSGGYFDGLYSFRDLLSALSKFVKQDEYILDDNFIKKWNSIYGHAHRYLEGHPLLDILEQIDNEI